MRVKRFNAVKGSFQQIVRMNCMDISHHLINFKLCAFAL